MFSVTSRYATIETATLELPDGRNVIYALRRFIPDSAKSISLIEHLVSQGERPDTITARYLSDPEQFWLVCDANNVMRPDELTDDKHIGQRILIPLPQGG
jgi:hypothetical protein